MKGLRIAGAIGMELTLAACASTPFAAQNKGMTGRWTLDAPHAPSCRMAFDGNSGANEGTILPDGGCPGDMFMSRRWALAKGKLTIKDQRDRPLATLKRAGGGFKGKSAAGMPVMLKRPTS
jgi:hypothetical protein